MSRATSKTRRFAGCLVTYEARAAKPAMSKNLAAYQVSEKLRPHIGTLMGKAGFCALLQRSLVLASQEVPWLHDVAVNADGTLDGWDRPARKNEDTTEQGGTVLVAQLLGLLVAFIGENLTLRLIVQIWPQLPKDELNFDKGDQNEKNKSRG